MQSLAVWVPEKMLVSGKTWKDQLQDRRWQKRRLQILERDEWCCVRCADADPTSRLDVHHKVYRWGCPPWEYSDDELDSRCAHCHKLTTLAQRLLRSNVSLLISVDNGEASFALPEGITTGVAEFDALGEIVPAGDEREFYEIPCKEFTLSDPMDLFLVIRDVPDALMKMIMDEEQDDERNSALES